jgi:hypothetical protein
LLWAIARHAAVQHGRIWALHNLRKEIFRLGKSQNLRLNSGLWIKLEQFSEVRRKSLTGLMNFALETC